MFQRNLPNLYSLGGSGSGAQGPQGPAGPPGASVIAESFSICRTSDNTLTPGTNGVSGNWTDTLPGSFTNFETATIYQNLTYGSLSLPGGTFTCGYTGTYRVSLSVYEQTNVPISLYLINTGSARDFCYLDLSNNDGGGQATGTTEQLVQLTSGDQILLNGFNSSGVNETIQFQSADPNSGRLVPTLIWTLELIDAAGPQGPQGEQGPQGPSGGTPATPESFIVALGANVPLAVGPPAFVTLAPLIDAVNPIDTPVIFGNSLYQNLNLSSLNLATGELTIGASGEYNMTYTAMARSSNGLLDVHIFVNGSPVNKSTDTPSGSNTIEDATINLQLSAGDIVTLGVWNLGGLPTSAEYLFNDTFGTGIVNYSITWSMQYIDGVQGPQGPVGPGSPTAPEGFAIALENNYAFTASDTYETITLWTDTVDVPNYPDVSEETLFQNLSQGGSINLTTGEFTVGADGIYMITFPTQVPGNNGDVFIYPFFNGTKHLFPYFADRSMYTAILNLSVGDVISLSGLSANLPNVIIAPITTPVTNPIITYTLIWSMIKIA